VQITMYRVYLSNSKYELIISVTDINDPLFLYSIDLSEQQFHALKEELNLHIDFQAFPQKFYEMLDLCVMTRDDLNKSSIGTYSCILEVVKENALLIIQETTQMRELNHIIIKMKGANDHNLKKYLSSLVKDYKSKCESLEKDNLRFSESLENYNLANRELKEEVDSLRLNL
jgi:spindle assembly abnormal protein 6